MNSRNYIYFLAFIFLFFVNCTKNNESYKTAIVKVNNGYGYEIYFKDKLLIKQLAIPSISKSLAFCDSIDALKISNIVVEKLKNNKAPTVSTAIIKNQHIKLDCEISQ